MSKPVSRIGSMFDTPPSRVVRTRGEIRREQLAEQKLIEESQFESNAKKDSRDPVSIGAASVKTEISATKNPNLTHAAVPSCSRASSTAERKKLEFQAAQAKIRLEMEAVRLEKELIDKKLAADLAELESRSGSSIAVSKKVEDWLNKSHQQCNQPYVDQIPNPASEIKSNVDGRIIQKPPPPPSSPPSSSRGSTNKSLKNVDDDLRKLREVFRDLMNSTAKVTSKEVTQELLSRLATSKDLPLYFGDPMEWLQFKQAFNESTKLCRYSETENVWRLRKCLRGEAKDAVASLLIGGTTTQEIIDILELRFGRPESVMHKIVQQLKKLPPLPSHYHSEIVNFSIKIKNYVAAAAAVKQNEYLHSPELIAIVISKLPTSLVTKWADYSYHQQGTSKLQLLSQFLYIEATKTAASGVSHIQSQSERRRSEERERRPHTVLFNLHTDEKAQIKCKFCRGRDVHNLDKCTRFKRAMRKDRWRFVRTNKLCYKCLGPQHGQQTCTAPDCTINGCGQPHHFLLHWLPAKDKRETERRNDHGRDDTGRMSNSETVAHTVSSNSDPHVLLKIVPVTIHGSNGNFSTHALLDDGATVTLLSSRLANMAGLHGESVTMRARSAWDSAEIVCETEVLSFEISSSSGLKYGLSARKMSELKLPKQRLPIIDASDNGRVSYSFNNDSVEVQPELLIGQDNYHLIAPIVCLRGKQSEPFITKTCLGWCVHGNVYLLNSFASAERFVTHSELELVDINCIRSNLKRSHACPALTTPHAHDPIVSAPMPTYSLFTLHRSSTYAAASSTVDMPPHTHAAAAAATAYLPMHNSYVSNDYYDMQLDDEVRRSFALESIGIISRPRKNPDDVRATAILNKTSELINDQWYVGLPWKNDDFVMPDSYLTALNRLKSVQKKLLRNEELALRYQDRIQHLLLNGYAKEMSEDEEVGSNHVWYLPHFGVDNPNKKKMRIVFDAAAKSKGFCLNDFLLQGPDLLQSLLGIMLRFRENPVAIIGDIKDMFLRIKIREEDQNALRFIWSTENKPVKIYVMTSLIFGANCSPFIAQYINQTRNPDRFIYIYPDAVKAIQSNQYMDDYIDSFIDEETAMQTMDQVSYIHSQGGFQMRNWTSNSLAVLERAPEENLSDTAVRFNVESLAERTLGLLWYPASDMFAFDLSFKRIPPEIVEMKQKPTKREMLRIIMSIYDIHGFLAPLTVKAKILMQRTWKSNLGWDQETTDDLFDLFKSWFSQLIGIRALRIPRWYFRSSCVDNKNERDNKHLRQLNASCGTETTLELHVLCDASPHAYAAVAYWRKQDIQGNVYVSFIASKNRVAPLKPVTIPRMELQGALLGCRLADTIKKEHRFTPTATFYWTDSTTVLYWIKNQSKTYKAFISHRLAEIDTLSSVEQWNYIPTDLNIADVATKNTEYLLTNDCEWFRGPSFLYSAASFWPQESEKKDIDESTLEKINTIVYETQNDLPVPDATRVSPWLRLVRSMAIALAFIKMCRDRVKTYKIDCALMEKAESLIIRQAQKESFAAEINGLKQGQSLENKSRLLNLTPFIDDQGLLRVGGRINSAKGVESSVKQPIILDGHHSVTDQLVKHFHKNAAHGHNELVVNELRQKYWILNLRPTVRRIASQCMFCRIRKCIPHPPRMGDLPEARLQHHSRPFTNCGVDLFGPMEITVGRRREKRYGVLFTCLTIRAVHVELVSSLTADSLIMALRRMAARRGWPRVIYSDNGTNLRGADVELKRSFAELDQQAVQTQAVNRGIDWRFISPVSPHMAGAWERLIRSIKTALKVVLKERAPHEETLATLMAEVENIINSRPLTHVSVDPRSEEALTPNHFLLGSSSNLPLPGVFNDGEIYSRRQWRIAQRLTELFWNRWLKEVLPALLPRQKWCTEGAQLKVGDLVVVVDPTSPRNIWPKGKVKTVYPGRDGRVRIVDIQTKFGVMKRPAVRVAVILSNDECRSYDTRAENVSDGNSELVV